MNNLTYKLTFHPGVKKDLRKIPKIIVNKIEQAILDLSINPFLGYKLEGKYKGLMAYDFSYRYRIIYGINKTKGLLTIYEIWHRGRDYKL